MLKVSFKPSFVRQVQKLETSLQEEISKKIELLKDSKNHRTLKVHKLHGKLSGCFGFSINYKIRIIFEYETKSEVVLLAVDDHDIYR